MRSFPRIRAHRAWDGEPLMPRAGGFTAPLHGARRGVLDLRHGRSRVVIRATESDVLCRAIFDRPGPKARAADGYVTIEYPRFSFAGLLRTHARRTEIELSATLPWSIVVAGGLRASTLDLAGLELNGLELQGGARNVRIRLSRPRGCVLVRLEGGASDVTLVRPAGVAAGLQLLGEASRLTFDDERYGAIGGETRLETAAAGSGDDRYEIEIDGGASRLTIASEPAGVSRPAPAEPTTTPFESRPERRNQ